jgi:hypothetical protein
MTAVSTTPSSAVIVLTADGAATTSTAIAGIAAEAGKVAAGFSRRIFTPIHTRRACHLSAREAIRKGYQGAYRAARAVMTPRRSIPVPSAFTLGEPESRKLISGEVNEKACSIQRSFVLPM